MLAWVYLRCTTAHFYKVGPPLARVAPEADVHKLDSSVMHTYGKVCPRFVSWSAPCHTRSHCARGLGNIAPPSLRGCWSLSAVQSDVEGSATSRRHRCDCGRWAAQAVSRSHLFGSDRISGIGTRSTYSSQYAVPFSGETACKQRPNTL